MGAGPLEESRPLKLRVFFGLPVPEEQRDVLAGYLAECSSRAPAFRWVPPANLHITVRFLGGVEPDLVDRLAEGLGGSISSGFEIELGELGAFKRGRLVRVVWIGLRSGAQGAADLASHVEAACVGAGLKAEARDFQPHLTLARARGRDGESLPPLSDLPTLKPWRTTELVLYQSRLGRTGAVYEPLRVLSLD